MHLPEEHESSGWHQEDLIAGNELQDILLIGCKFVQEVSDEHQAIGAHRLQRRRRTSEAEETTKQSKLAMRHWVSLRCRYRDTFQSRSHQNDVFIIIHLVSKI